MRSKLLAIAVATAVLALTVAMGVAIAHGAPRIVTYLIAIPLGSIIGFVAGAFAFDRLTGRGEVVSFRRPTPTAAIELTPIRGEIVPFRPLALPAPGRAAA